MFLDDTACNLASINLVKFYDDQTGKFDVEAYVHTTRIWTVILEISVLMSQLPSKEIARLTYKYRTLGLGYANIGSLLMRQGVAYDSERGFAITGALTAIMTGEAYATSAEMASVLGAFERYQVNKRHMLRVIRNHRRAAYNVADDQYEGLTIKPMGISADYCPEYLLKAAQESWDAALMLGELYGYRNAQTTVIAPTGTIGLVMDCDTTGIEPDFALVKFKKLVGGGYFKIVNQSIEPALINLGYAPDQIKEIVDYVIGAQTLENAPYINTKTLAAKGFTAKELGAVEALLPSAMDLKFVFTKWVLTEDFLINTLKFSAAEASDSNLDILSKLGFTADEIAAATEYICGTQTVEGAPYLKAEHLPVFDCANRCGDKGTRFISSLGHIKQMAAAQPFITGAISKTINLPEEATFTDVAEAYMASWKLMLKANALYRDGSKLSQPLNVGSADSALAKLFKFDQEEEVDETISVKEVQTLIAQASSKPTRRKLPEERHSITHKFNVAGHKGYITVGLYENGTPGEVFITMDKEGSTLSGIMDALTYTVSIALQYGVPMESIVKKFVHTRFEPSGVTANSEIPMAKSIIDYIGRYLAVKFLPKDRAQLYHNSELIDRSYQQGSNYRVQIPVINGKGFTEIKYGRTEQLNKIAAELQSIMTTEVVVATKEEVSVNAIDIPGKGVAASVADSNACDNCGGKMRRAGSCFVCTECGSTSGCS
jgi:ribonucleoside-diphosphate reductase alpha chain